MHSLPRSHCTAVCSKRTMLYTVYRLKYCLVLPLHCDSHTLQDRKVETENVDNAFFTYFFMQICLKSQKRK